MWNIVGGEEVFIRAYNNLAVIWNVKFNVKCILTPDFSEHEHATHVGI